jgi:hypothetical protein
LPLETKIRHVEVFGFLQQNWTVFNCYAVSTTPGRREIMHRTRNLVFAALALTIFISPAFAELILKPGAIKGTEVHLAKARDYAYCEIAPVIGKPPKTIAQFYNTSGLDPSCPAEPFAAIDGKNLAAELKADMVYMNPTPQTARRHWVMDQLWIFKAGETVDFGGGVKATWVASMSPADLKGGLKGPFEPAVIHRESKYLYAKGSTVFLMRAPGGKTYVMQSYATEVDKGLTFAQLPQLGSKLTMPDGWKFETKQLTKDLTIDPRKAKGTAHIIRDNFHNVYEGCGFDAACSYVP